MARLPRPSIPLEVKCRVALRQLGEIWPDELIAIAREGRSLGTVLTSLKDRLAELLACDVSDLRLDHDPALGAREKIVRDGKIVGYVPAANDHNFLIYRPHAEHLVKTNIRGEHGQHPDRVLIKKQRRLDRKQAKRKPRAKFKSRKLQSANRWPPKGSQKIPVRASRR